MAVFQETRMYRKHNDSTPSGRCRRMTVYTTVRACDEKRRALYVGRRLMGMEVKWRRERGRPKRRRLDRVRVMSNRPCIKVGIRGRRNQKSYVCECPCNPWPINRYNKNEFHNFRHVSCSWLANNCIQPSDGDGITCSMSISPTPAVVWNTL